MSEETFSISIPADADGYILLQCEHCGEFFKLRAEDINDEGLFHIFCPACGLTSESYITADVLELVNNKALNYAMDTFFDAFKEMERKSRHSSIQIKAGKKPKHLQEDPIRSGIDELSITYFQCCHRAAKVKPLLKFTGCYCPFCGVKDYETESQ